MDMHFGYEPSSAAASVYSCRPESEFKTMSRRSSSVADTFQELESVGEVVTRFELDMACVCEKLANLNLLLMHMETIESEFESLVSDMNPKMSSDLEFKALEFDFLSGFLNSEVSVLETEISNVQNDESNMQEFISSSKYLGDTSMEQEDMLRDSEKSLKQSMDQLLELKMRAAMFEKNVSRFSGGETRTTDKDDSVRSCNNDLPELKDKMNVQTVEHQRHILRMLEKSLEREIEFEKRVSESTQIEEALTMRLHSSEQEVLLAEEETILTLEKLYEADHTSETLMGISKELLSTINTLQVDQHKHSDSKHREETVALKERIVKAERRAENAETKCKFLTNASNEIKSSSEQKVGMLEKKLMDTKHKLKLSKSRRNSLEDIDSMVVMMVEVGGSVYSWTLKMDAATNREASSPPLSLYSGGRGSELNKSSVSLQTSSRGDTILDSESSGEIVARYELDTTCICEKLTNLNMLSFQVESMESDFEAFPSDVEPEMAIKALEYNLLSGFLDSELSVLETCISDLQREEVIVKEFLSSRKQLGELMGMEDTLHDSEKSLEQSLEQVSELKSRSAKFDKNLLRFAGDEAYTESSNDSDNLELKENLKMQNAEHQRHVLMMLDKALKREINLEQRVTELGQVEETLTMRVRVLEQEVLDAEEQAETALKKFYVADHTSDLFMETSRELISKIEMLHINLIGSTQREAELEKRVAECESQLVNEKASAEQIVVMENSIIDLREQIIEAESRLVNSSKDTYEKVVELETELSDARAKLQHAEALNEASQEENLMLKSTIKDMGDVIEDMKKKTTQAEIDNESMEDRCIFLSESNEDLKKELSLAKSRVKCLQASLHQMEVTKKESAEDISFRSKLLMDMAMQMAIERERLQKQISSLKQQNKIFKHLKKKDVSPAVNASHGDKANNFTTESKEALSTSFELEKAHDETVMDSPEAVRNIDVREISRKVLLKVLLILIVPLLGMLLYGTQVP
uniref:WPP domain-interacting tail-anchored protein 2-like n=1 Tax=Erigeron canadensis TaxID=72917 RepID=UPI001CB9AC09|nr:WPP domain-interacting tail-anchored protein 2-like [Erigeron canadensis]